MTVQELYKRLGVMVNRLDSNKGVSIPIGIFVLLYNSEQLRWLAEELKKSLDNIDVNLIELLLSTDYEILPVSSGATDLKFIEYALPSDFFQVYSSYSLASRGECSGIPIYNWEKKPGDINAARSDSNTRPSFDYQEAPFIIAKDRLKLYYDDYVINNTYVEYYRSPRSIDMAGYKHFDGTPSTNIDPELDDHNAEQVLARVVAEIQRITTNGEGIQAAIQRIKTEF